MTLFKRIARPACLALLLAALAFPGAASAQSGDHVPLGVGAGVVPDFQGSDAYRFMPIPVLDAQFGQCFVSLRNGIGVNGIADIPMPHGSHVSPVGALRYRAHPTGGGR